MDAVVGQFLDYARLGEQEPAVATDLKALAISAAAPFTGHAGGLKLELDELPPAMVRPLLLKRALANLLDNAIKHGDGDVVPQLGTEEWQGRPFVRLDAARSSAGSGLGLAIVERAARLHSGELRLEARDGGGLKATVTIPLTAG